MRLKGTRSWADRPRDYPTLRVSQLPEHIRKLAKRYLSGRRWTTDEEVQRLMALQKHENWERSQRDKKPPN